jgi:hypothetical protein
MGRLVAGERCLPPAFPVITNEAGNYTLQGQVEMTNDQTSMTNATQVTLVIEVWSLVIHATTGLATRQARTTR